MDVYLFNLKFTGFNRIQIEKIQVMKFLVSFHLRPFFNYVIQATKNIFPQFIVKNYKLTKEVQGDQ